MEFEGKVWKDLYSSWWIAEIFFLNVITQGKTRTEALVMIKDAVVELLKDSYKLNKKFRITINSYGGEIIGLGANDHRLLLAFGLKRQRLRSGATIREVSKRLQSNSPNAYARYERGNSRPSLEKYAKLLHAANPERKPLLLR